VILRNQPIYDQETVEWLRRYAEFDLTGDQKRLLAFTHAHEDRFTSKDYQKLTELDVYKASLSIKAMVRKDIIRSTSKGSRVYELVETLGRHEEPPETLSLLLPLFKERDISNLDIRDALGMSRPTATRIAGELCAKGWLEKSGSGRWTRYRLARAL